MGNPVFRFTLYNSTVGTKEISEPDGWKKAVLKLERHPDFHSLVEYFEGSFVFYGASSAEDGGLNFIKNVENRLGFDAELLITIDISFNEGTSFENVFTGQLDLSQIQELPDNKIEVPIIRNGLWAKFIARKETPVDIQSTTNLDGESVTVVSDIDLKLTPQKLRYYGEYNWKENVDYNEDTNYKYHQLDWEEVVKDDIKKFNLPRTTVANSAASSPPTGISSLPATGTSLLPGIMEAPWDGEYTFDIRIESAVYGTTWAGNTNDYKHYIGVAGSDISAFKKFTASTSSAGLPNYGIYTFNGSFFLKKGQQVCIFSVQTAFTGLNRTIFGTLQRSWLTSVKAATTGAITLSGTQTVDGVALTATQRCLVKDQGDTRENGVYVVSAGAWTRATDANTSIELQNAAITVDSGGTTNGSTYWNQVQDNLDLGVTPCVFELTQPDQTRFLAYPGAGTPDTHLIITADTTYPETTCEAFFMHDVFGSVLQRIL